MPTSVPRPTAIDLFAGCGGLSLGLKQARFTVVGAVEVDPLAAKTYRRNHRRTVLWERDIRRLAARTVLERLGLKKGQLDLLAGCPPCQGFSAVRTLNGKRRAVGPNANLVIHFLRFVRVLRPKAVLLENVPALASNWRLKRFKASLRSLGYQLHVEIRDAQEFGVPQRRRRMILLAHIGDKPGSVPALAVRNTVRGSIQGLAPHGRSGDPCHDLPEKRSNHMKELIRAIPKNGGSRKDAGSKFLLNCHRQTEGFKDVYGRMAWDRVAPTITGGCVNPSKGRFLHPSQNRAITLREAALLQGFPASYYFALEGGKFAAAQMIGNAFPPGFARAQALYIGDLIRKGWTRA